MIKTLIESADRLIHKTQLRSRDIASTVRRIVNIIALHENRLDTLDREIVMLQQQIDKRPETM